MHNFVIYYYICILLYSFVNIMAKLFSKIHTALPDRITSELKYIKYGLVSHQIGEDIYFIYKNEEQSGPSYSQSDELLIQFDPILRDEFPSIRMIIRFIINGAEILSIPYYISVESEQEINHLYKLNRSDHINMIFFYDNKPICHKFELAESDIEEINKILKELDT